MAEKTIKMKWESLAPWICHNGELANPMAASAKALKTISGKRAKTDSDHEAMAKIEFLGSLYTFKGNVVVPADMIEAVLNEGAKKTREGKLAKAGLYCTEHSLLIYDGPQNPEGLWQDENFRKVSRVKVQGSSIMRTRPFFERWSVNVTIAYNDEVLNGEQVIGFARKAGSLVGIGDWRPRYGRFKVVA